MVDKEIDIHCNILNCRKPIYYEQKACVTTCSHIFCTECANVKFSEALICPACQTSLTQKTDIMIVQLNPTEEYKSSILAGLKPEHIFDICNRGLSFYNYQISQELCYRQMMQKALESKIISLDNQIQDNLREYNRLLKLENDKLEALTREYEMEKRRNYDLQEELKQKSTQFTKLQQIYEKLKQKSIGSNIEHSINQTGATNRANHSMRFSRQPYQESFTSNKSYQPIYHYDIENRDPNNHYAIQKQYSNSTNNMIYGLPNIPLSSKKIEPNQHQWIQNSKSLKHQIMKPMSNE